MLIRAATLDDVDRLVALGRRSYRDHFASLWGPAALEAYLDGHFDPARLARDLAGGAGVHYVLALDGDEAIGFAKTNDDRPVPPELAARGVELEKIYFTSAAAGAGHGARLLAHVIETAADAGAPRVWLDVLKSNERGVRFYERHGFARHAEIPFATDRAEIGMWVMVRTLGPP
jgi:diamine N-acetyltransferase